ncbi:hypothetical protein QTN25_000337 [Entamoeba marina]
MNLIGPKHGKFNSFTIIILALNFLQKVQLIPNLQDQKFIKIVDDSNGTIIRKQSLICNSEVEYVSASNPQMDDYKQKLDNIDVVNVIRKSFKFYNKQRLSETILLSPHILLHYNITEINVFAPFVGFLNITTKLGLSRSEVCFKYTKGINEIIESLMTL